MHTCTCNSVTVSKCSIFTYITKKHTWIYIYIYIHIHILYMYIYIYIYIHATAWPHLHVASFAPILPPVTTVSRGCGIDMTVSPERAAFLKSIKSRNSDSPVSRGTNSNWDFGLIWICIVKIGFLDWVDFGGVAFSVESFVVQLSIPRIIVAKIYWFHDCSVLQCVAVCCSV